MRIAKAELLTIGDVGFQWVTGELAETETLMVSSERGGWKRVD